MDSIPLTYDSLRTVLQNTEANRRLLLAAHIPSIRSAEKSAPLKVETISFGEITTYVNHKSYEVTVRRENDKGVWNSYWKKNLAFKSEKDVDKYGMEEDLKETVLPGDVVFEKVDEYFGQGDLETGRNDGGFQFPYLCLPVKAKHENADMMVYLEKQIELNSKKLETIRLAAPHIDIEEVVKEEMIKENQGKHSRQFLHGMFDIKYRDTVEASTQTGVEQEVHRFRRSSSTQTESGNSGERGLTSIHIPPRSRQSYTSHQLRHPDIEKEVKEAVKFLWMSIKIQQYELKHRCEFRDRVEPDFELQLSITGNPREPETGDYIERVKYTKKIHEARKSIMHFILGDRMNRVYVKNATIFRDNIIRAPFGLRMKIRGLNLFGNVASVYTPLRSIIDESSYPLEKLICNTEDGEDYEHNDIRSAKHLVLSPTYRTQLLPILRNFRNRKVHITRALQLTSGDLVELIEIWMEEGRDIGTCFSFAIRKESILEDILKFVKNEYIAAVIGDDWKSPITIPMKSSSSDYELKIFNVQTWENKNFWDLYIAVQQIGSTETFANNH